MKYSKENLVNLLKCVASDLNDSADDIVDEMMTLPLTDFAITIDLGFHGGQFDSLPRISVMAEHISKHAADYYSKESENNVSCSSY